jgi:hypothetical protein
MRAASIPAAAPGVECIVTGHLARASAPLVRGYVRACAQGGPVAILRLEGGTLTIEIFAAQRASLQREPVSGGGHHSFASALEAARIAAPRLIVHVDETHEPDVLTSIADAPGFTRIGVLCGSDDTAVVATYRTIKRLFAHEQLTFHVPGRDSHTSPGNSGQARSQDAGELGASNRTRPLEATPGSISHWLTAPCIDGVPLLGVAMLGSESDKAAQAFARFSRAAQTFLGASLPGFWADVSNQGPAPVTLYRAGFDGTMSDLVERVASVWKGGNGQYTGNTPHALRAIETQQRAEVTPQPLAHGKAPIARAASTTLAAGVAQLAGDLRLPAPGEVEGPYADLLDLGLTLLESRSPYNQRVELCCDAQGVLHLVACAGPSGTREAAGDLLTVASWARDHAALLALAHRGLAGDQLASNGPVLHVVTREARDLRGVISTGVRLHLATPIIMGSRTRWVCREVS